MVYGVELEIRRLLAETDSPLAVADHLLKRWERGELSWKDQEITCEFLLNAGFLPALFDQVAKCTRTRQHIPWACFFEALGKVKLRLTKEEIDQLLVGASEEDALYEISRSRALDSWDPRFSKIRSNVRAERQAKLLKSKPRPQTVVDSDRTRPMIEKIKARKITLAEWARRAEEIPIETVEKFKQIAKDMIQYASSEKSTAYDIAISLRFMSLPQEALSALRFAEPTPAVLWLELDLLLETHRFVEVLDKADVLEAKFSGDPDASFSAVYSRAIALHGLGEKKEAKELLEGIVKIRPNYRSAHSLLLKWMGEEAP